jgi:hypothetical protein
MNKINSRGFSGLAVFLMLAIFSIIGVTGWYVYSSRKTAGGPSQAQSITNFEQCVAAGNPVMDSFPEQCAANGQTFTKEVIDNQAFNGAGWQDVTSSKGAFTVSIPEGWEDLQSAKEFDGLIIKGEKQPTAKVGQKVAVAEIENFCCHGPNVFRIDIRDNDQVAEPVGTTTDIAIPNGDKSNSLKGKRYVFEYTKDDAGEGLGGQRIKGDRDYVYIFNLANERVLHIAYSVFAADPRNQIETVDALVQSIRANQ